MNPWNNNLTRKHGLAFLLIWAVFTVWTFLITNARVDDGPKHDARVFRATAGTITGPLTGAISRDFQSCCLSFSLTVMGYCALFLLLGLVPQFLALPDSRWVGATRMLLRILGWLVWFLGGIFSFAHALS